MNHAFISNYLSGSICINPLNYLELRLDLLPSLPHREDRPSPYRQDLVEADINVSRVKSNCVQLAVSLTTLFVAPSVVFFCRASLAPLPLVEKSADL